MTIRESIQSQWKTLKNRSAKEKLSYLWDYYGIKALCALIGVAIVIAFVVSMVNQKEQAYLGVFFGATPQGDSLDFLQDFADIAQINTKEQEITVQTSLDIRMDDQITDETYQAMQSFAAMVAASMVDNFAADQELFLYYAYLGYATDLRAVLSDDQLAALEPWLYYIDGDLLRQSTEDGLAFEYGQCPDPRDPSAMVDPIPVGIDITTATDAFRGSYTFASENVALGICAGSAHPETASTFLTFAFGLL